MNLVKNTYCKVNTMDGRNPGESGNIAMFGSKQEATGLPLAKHHLNMLHAMSKSFVFFPHLPCPPLSVSLRTRTPSLGWGLRGQG